MLNLRRTHLVAALAAFVLAVAPAAQAPPSRAYDPPPQDYRSPSGTAASGQEQRERFSIEGHYESLREVEVALSNETFWVALRTPLRAGPGFFELGFLASQDDDFFASARFLRTGSPSTLPELRLGLGLGLFGAWLDQVNGRDEDVYGLALCGGARYAFRTELPTFVGIDLAYAPDVTTWDGGERLFDSVVRFEAEVSSFATAFVGYRFLEVELDRGTDHELDDRVQVGIRLGF